MATAEVNNRRLRERISDLERALEKYRAVLLTARGWAVANHDRLNAKRMMDKINDVLPYSQR